MTKPKKPEDLLPVGRPELYKPEYAKMVYKFALLGLKDKEIADCFCVSEPTLNSWKNDHPEFFKSLVDGKTIADAKVACKGYEVAMGGIQTKDVKTEYDEHGSIVKVTEDVKTTQPNQKAIEWWLKNRRPKDWNIQKDLHITGDLFGSILDDCEVIDAEVKDIE